MVKAASQLGAFPLPVFNFGISGDFGNSGNPPLSSVGGPSFRRFLRRMGKSSLLLFLCVSKDVALLRASVSPW